MNRDEALIALGQGKTVKPINDPDPYEYWILDKGFIWIENGSSKFRVERIPNYREWRVVGERHSMCGAPLPGMQVLPPKLNRLEARLAYLEQLHDVIWPDGGQIEKLSVRQIMKHTGDLWRNVE
jgi:hypothetical protein